MRVGIFGGTFDPPHLGHLIAATDACDQLKLDRILFIPTGNQPLKPQEPEANGADRFEMVRRLAALDPRFEADPIEVERGGVSFTVDTLRALRQRWPAGTAEMVLLLGTDAAAQFPRWRDTDGIRALAEVCVLTRGEGPESPPFGMRRVPTRRVDISATEIRDRVRAGKPVGAFLTESVAAYIALHGLYRQTKG